MDSVFYVIFLLFVFARLITFIISRKNEKRLKENGAVEYGKPVSIMIIIFIGTYTFAVLAEGIHNKVQFSQLTIYGLTIYLFSMVMIAVVIRSLGSMWTVKLIIDKENQIINKNFIFKYIRHPNYFLGIFPELVGMGLIFDAMYSMAFIMPLAVVAVIIRIIQEERVMREHFPAY